MRISTHDPHDEAGITTAEYAVGIMAACEAGTRHGLRMVTAGNYGGKLGQYHFHLKDVLS